MVDFKEFIIKQGILQITIGTTIAFAVTNYMKTLRKEIILPYLLKIFKIKNIFVEFLIASIEFFIILFIVFLLFKYLIYPSINKKNKNELEDKFKDNLYELDNN